MVSWLARIPARLVARTGLCAIGLFAVMGTWYMTDARHAGGGWRGAIHLGSLRLHGWNLDGEFNFPTAFSALLLVAACGVGLLAATTSHTIGISPWRLAPVAALLGIMSLDEAWELHEQIEAAAGVDWQVLYAPVMAVAGFLAFGLMHQLRAAPVARTQFLAGGIAWAASQVLEAIQWDGARLRIASLIVPEETFEMAGSLLFLLAFLGIIRAAVDASTTPAPAVSSSTGESSRTR